MKSYRYKTRAGDTYSIEFDKSLRVWAVKYGSQVVAYRNRLVDIRSLMTEVDECHSSLLVA